MNYFTVAALLAMTTSAFAGTLSTTPSVRAGKWISVESGINTEASNATLSKRTGAEVITCYQRGTSVDRAPSVSVIDDWCDNHAIGQHVSPGETIWSRYDYGTFTILVSARALTNCGGFTVDDTCHRLLRLPLDLCNIGKDYGKKGGFETDLCGQWRFDPGSKGTDM